MNALRSVRLSALLILGLAACGKRENQSVVVVAITAQPALKAAASVDITVGSTMRTFTLTSGLDGTPVKFGVFIEPGVNGLQDITATAHTPGPCTEHMGKGSVTVPAGHKGAILEASVAVTTALGCNGSDAGTGTGGAGGSGTGGAGGSGPPSGMGGATGQDAAAGGAPGVDTGPTADLAPDAPIMALPPPSLTRCQIYDHGPLDCGPMISPYQSVFAAFSSDGKRVVSAGLDNGIKFWKVEGAALVADTQVLSSDGQARVAFSPDGKLLAVGADKGQLYLFDFAQGSQLPLTGHDQRVRSLEFSRDGSRLFTVDLGGSLRVWDVATRQPVGTPITIPAQPWSLALLHNTAPGEAWVAVAISVAKEPAADGGAGLPAGGHVYLVNTLDPSKHVTLTFDAETEPRDYIAMAVSPDGKRLAAGGLSSIVKVWDISNRMMAKPLPDVAKAEQANTNIQPATALGFSPDGRYIVIGHGGFFLETRVRIVDLQTNQIRNEAKPALYAPFSAAFSPSGDAVVAGASNCNRLIYCHD